MVGSKKYSIGAIWFDKEKKQEFVLLSGNGLLVDGRDVTWYTTRYVKAVGSERRANCTLVFNRYEFRKK